MTATWPSEPITIRPDRPLMPLAIYADLDYEPVPKRIQRRRSKGWRMPPNTVYVGRPTRWGNAHREGDNYALVDEMGQSIEATGDVWIWMRGRALRGRADLVAAYRQDLGLCSWQEIAEVVAPLQGQNLACYCPLCERHANGRRLDIKCPKCQPCHVDVLAEFVL